MRTDVHPDSQTNSHALKVKTLAQMLPQHLKKKKNLQTAWNMPLRVSYMKIKVIKKFRPKFRGIRK